MFKYLNLGGLTWKELATRVWSEMNDDDIFGRAAQLSYYFLLALFPALLFLTSMLGMIAGENSQMRADLFGYLSAVLPETAFALVKDNLHEVIETSGGGKISLGLLATLWAASNGMGAISQTLNITYDVEETRSWWKVRLAAIGLTISLAVLIIGSLILILYGHDLAEAAAVWLGFGDAFETAWKVVQWPIVLAFVLLAFALIYYFGPCIKDQHWKWVTPGALIGVGLWLLVSFGFKIYLSYFNSYSATYGSLGAVIILMLWFYLTGAAILIGGEINSEIENAAAERGDPTAKEEGKKEPDAADAGAGGVGKSKDEDKKPRIAAASARGRTEGRTHAEAMRASSASSEGRRRFSLGKLAVVMGAWVFSRFRSNHSRER